LVIEQWRSGCASTIASKAISLLCCGRTLELLLLRLARCQVPDCQVCVEGHLHHRAMVLLLLLPSTCNRSRVQFNAV
jgi:hypothetical protein